MTESATAAFTQCQQCGQVDSDPKVHFWDGRTVHNDCTSTDEQAQIQGSTDPNAAKVLDACLGGLRGPELRERAVALSSGKPASKRSPR